MQNQNYYYKNLPPDKLEEVFSNFLVDSWSYSKVASFARNEKHFEMQYLYCVPNRRSSSEVSGSAYHKALDYYFLELKQGRQLQVSDLQVVAFQYIDEVAANDWKLQKTTPTIEECIKKANEDVSSLLNNFFSDLSVYELEGCEILGVEEYCDEFLFVNGVEIPLPCHARIDLVIKTKDSKVVIIDHKTKKSFTDEKELKFTIGRQAITYVKCYEAKYNVIVDEVWFIENKSSKNKDKSPQLSCFKIVLDKDNRRLYEAILYEPLKRMLEAVSNPDYVYLINDNDNYIDKAELYEFWCQTMLAEVSDFNIPENKKELMAKRQRKIKDASLASISPSIIKKFRENAAEFISFNLTNKDMTNEQKIEHVLRTLGVTCSVAKTFSGYSSNTYLLELSAGINLSSVFRYKLDIANALDVSSIRIMKDLFVYEGKSYLCVESSKKREIDLLFDEKYLQGSKIPLGMDNFGNIVFWDIGNPSTPHVVICGATGSGKSVTIISIIEFFKLTGFDKILILDPKFEFTRFKSSSVFVYNDIKDIEDAMKQEVENMNEKVRTGNNSQRTLIVFDEFADALAQSRKGLDLNIYDDVCVGSDKYGQPKYKRQKIGVEKSLDENLRILLQKGRSSGYRIIAATQRASVKVITGDSKVNFPVQICFRVPKAIDSVVVLGSEGAESLSGKGDGLINSPEYFGVVRFQGFYKNN